MNFLDAYSIRARLFPAILAIAPAIVLFLLAATWTHPGLPEFITAIAVAVLFFAAADLARRMGRRKERQLYVSTGGSPENRELSHADGTFDVETKDRYRRFLAQQIGRKAPTREDEIRDPDAAGLFYRQCYTWLRENTRDTEKFRVLFNENINYGFRRNLLGLKPFGITLNLAALIAAVATTYFEPDFARFTPGELVILGGLLIIHALYVAFGVTKAAVLDASKTYARQLILSCEMFTAQAKYAQSVDFSSRDPSLSREAGDG